MIYVSVVILLLKDTELADVLVALAHFDLLKGNAFIALDINKGITINANELKVR